MRVHFTFLGMKTQCEANTQAIYYEPNQARTLRIDWPDTQISYFESINPAVPKALVAVGMPPAGVAAPFP